MKLDEMKERWQAKETTRSSEPGDAELVEDVRSRAERFDRRIRVRDWLETAAGVIGSIPFVLLLFHGSWLARVGAVVVILSGVQIVWRLHSTRRRSAASAGARSLVVSLRAERDRLDAQIDLLEGVFWWYLAPLDVGLVLAVVGTAGGALEGAVILVGLSLLNALILWLNRRAVRRKLRPRRRRVDAHLRQVHRSNAGPPEDRGADPAG